MAVYSRNLFGPGSGPGARDSNLQRHDAGVTMAKLFTIPVLPDAPRTKRGRKADSRYVEGQRLLVQAMRYLAQTDPRQNRPAISLLSDHFRNKFRMSDHPQRGQ